MMNMAGTKADQHLVAARVFTHISGGIHGPSPRSLPVLTVVDTLQRRDFTGTHAVMGFGSGHGSMRHRSGAVIDIEQYLAIAIATVIAEEFDTSFNIDVAHIRHHYFGVAMRAVTGLSAVAVAAPCTLRAARCQGCFQGIPECVPASAFWRQDFHVVTPSICQRPAGAVGARSQRAPFPSIA
jgi:hypothetical protein